MTDAAMPTVRPAQRARRAPQGWMRISGYIVIALSVVVLYLITDDLGSHSPDTFTIVGFAIGGGAFGLGVLMVIAGAIEQRLIEINETLKNR